MKSVVITGATGMIGYSLVEYLLQNGIKVTAILRPNSSKRDIMPNHPLLSVYECSLSRLYTFKVPKDFHADVFFHLGWDGTNGESRNDCYVQNDNIKYTLYAVDLARKMNCKTFVYAGSQAQYGRVEGILTNSVPSNPETAYGMAKLCAESMSRKRCQEFGITHSSVRILSVYGPYDGENTMIASTIRKMLKNEPTMFTACEQEWDYLYVKDAAKALYLVAQKATHGSVYRLGSGERRKLSYYIEIIRDIINPDAELGIGKLPYSDNQVMMLGADISDLKNDVGFEPEYSFQDGIWETIDWCRKKMDL